MPLTPLHAVFAYLANKGIRKLSLPALIVGSMLPDLEIPFIYLMTGGLYGRLFLHSLLGVATLGTFLSVLLTIFLYPPVVSLVFGLDREKVEERCRFSSVLLISCLLGCLSHVLIDSLHHEFNPLLYPFVNESFDSFVLLNNWQLASFIVQFVLLVILLLVLFWEVGKGTKGFWKRVLVG